MTHFFISYAKTDTSELAFALEKALESLPDVSVWVDKDIRIADSAWSRQIQRELDRCDYMIVLLSPDVNRPEDHPNGESYVLTEIRYMGEELRKKKFILPIMVSPVRVPIELTGRQRIDMVNRTLTEETMSWLIERICIETGIQGPRQQPAKQLSRTEYRVSDEIIGIFCAQDKKRAHLLRFYENGEVLSVVIAHKDVVRAWSEIRQWFHRTTTREVGRGTYILRNRNIEFVITSDAGAIEYKGVLEKDKLILDSYSYISENRQTNVEYSLIALK